MGTLVCFLPQLDFCCLELIYFERDEVFFFQLITSATIFIPLILTYATGRAIFPLTGNVHRAFAIRPSGLPDTICQAQPCLLSGGVFGLTSSFWLAFGSGPDVLVCQANRARATATTKTKRSSFFRNNFFMSNA